MMPNYQRLKWCNRQVLSLEDFTEADIQAIGIAESPLKANVFNHEFIVDIQEERMLNFELE